jgi:hypothetical protein
MGDRRRARSEPVLSPISLAGLFSGHFLCGPAVSLVIGSLSFIDAPEDADHPWWGNGMGLVGQRHGVR